jgi:hypothetical protein
MTTKKSPNRAINNKHTETTDTDSHTTPPHLQQLEQPTPQEIDEEFDYNAHDSMNCIICHETIQNKWHSVWITPQNSKQYMECFKESTGYDGKQLGRACRTCYNRFFSYSHSKKYSNVLCICCTKTLSKRSYPFSSFAHVYRSLFPNIDSNVTDGRVCTTCYDKVSLVCNLSIII